MYSLLDVSVLCFEVRKLVGTKSPKPIVASAIKQKYAASKKLQFSQAENMAAPAQMYPNSRKRTIPTGTWQCSKLWCMWCSTAVAVLLVGTALFFAALWFSSFQIKGTLDGVSCGHILEQSPNLNRDHAKIYMYVVSHF